MRWIGAVIVFVCCGYFGLSKVLSHKREEKALHQILSGINYMECELQYRLTPLPELLRQTSKQISGIGSSVFAALATELENQISPDVSCCMEAVIRQQEDLPQYAMKVFCTLGQCLGRFDLQGQLTELDSVRRLCRRFLSDLEANRDVRLRSYQTLGLCAGAALAILLL